MRGRALAGARHPSVGSAPTGTVCRSCHTRLECLDCRDAFLGLMRIAGKLGITYWGYLGDRLSIPGRPNVQYLPDLIRCRSQPA